MAAFSPAALVATHVFTPARILLSLDMSDPKGYEPIDGIVSLEGLETHRLRRV